VCVQVITGNVINYVAASRFFMERYQTLYWTPISHCIDLMLKDKGKISWIKDIIESANIVTKCVCMCFLSLMRRSQGSRSWCILQSCVSPLASFLFSLSSLLCWRCRECFFQMSGMLVYTTQNWMGSCNTKRVFG